MAVVTRRARGLDAEVELDSDEDGMPRPCVANLDAIATIERRQLSRLITALGTARMRQVERAVHLALGIDLPWPIT